MVLISTKSCNVWKFEYFGGFSPKISKYGPINVKFGRPRFAKFHDRLSNEPQDRHVSKFNTDSAAGNDLFW